jgi:putative transposase
VRDRAVLVLHLLMIIARLAGPGGARAVVAESVRLKHQLLILNRTRKRAPNLRVTDRVVAGSCALLMRRARLVRSAIVLKPATLLRLHRALKTRKYRLLFSPTARKKPGPRGPSRDVVAAVVEMKRRNPTWGCPRIAQQITLAFDVPINKDVVRRILAARDRPEPDSAGPSWLTVLGHAKDSLWSLDLFRCESAVLRTHWVLVVMDQFTRRIVGFGVHRGVVDGVGLCRCSIARCAARHCQPTSARTTTRCLGSSNGNGIFAFSTYPKSRPLLSLVILVVRAAMWRPSNTLSGSLRRSSITTTATGLIAGCLSRHDHESETVSALRAPSTSTTG